MLTGGELPALVLTDAVARMCEGVLPDAVCFEEESHYNGLLEYPQYTRPEVWHEQAVPPVLLSGHHKNIETWRFAASFKATAMPLNTVPPSCVLTVIGVFSHRSTSSWVTSAGMIALSVNRP